ncbi:cadherin-86C isoform X2 [Drosophila albomicans]|uniref:Cadherin-86C isoform X2 n=1 Tax=Drosophila albomicans TaxID=7291 RepID=A0A9C6T9S7_DROAB|nr:cadherin-86C isoform X2 [Drosophila albomicans]
MFAALKCEFGLQQKTPRRLLVNGTLIQHAERNEAIHKLQLQLLTGWPKFNCQDSHASSCPPASQVHRLVIIIITTSSSTQHQKQKSKQKQKQLYAMASSSSNSNSSNNNFRSKSHNLTHVPQCRLRTGNGSTTTTLDASCERGQKECYYYQPPTSQHQHQLQLQEQQQQQQQQQQPLQQQQQKQQQHRHQCWPSLQFGRWLSAMTAYRLLTISLLIGILCLHHVHGVDPKFDPSTRMRLVLVPADAQVGSVIYRLRATDEEFDYPLTFEFMGDASSSTVKVESLPCTKYNSVCQANVVLQRRLEPGRYYDFQVSVKDTNGGIATQLCSITATNFTTPHDLIFPHKPGIIMIPEDAKRGSELDYVIARKNPLYQKPVYLELWGSPLFAIRQKIVSAETTEGTVFLLGPLDFEKQAMYHITILANDAYAEPGQDSRNIAGMEIVVIVQDVQDQPPVFTLAPPVTKLPPGILPGDKILQVHAEDGDKGNPREVRYGLVSENNPFTSFFDINDTSGEIFLMRPLEDIAAITHVGDPVLLTVIAEEVKVGRDEPPAMASTVQLAFFLPERTNSPPYFENDHYVSRVDENAPQGTALTFIDPYVPRVYDDDTGKNGVFSLTLLNNNGTFEITPNVAERSASFLIRVRDNSWLDYEQRHSVQFNVLAQELGPATNLSAIVNVTVYINDVNDNTPVFDQPAYTVDLPENMTVGTKVVQVHASDLDSGLGGKVRYTAILGYLNTSLNLNAEDGSITVSTNSHGFDREVMPEYHLYVEARDMDGNGNRAQVPLIIKLIDVNDEVPVFDKDLYEFILATDLQSFTTNAFIHATDKDATAPNNVVRYEIINGNYENNFVLDKVSGELTVREKIKLRSKKQVSQRRRRAVAEGEDDVFILTARAYDLGVPVRFSTTMIRIYPPESRKRTVTFVVPGLNPDKRKTEETLSAITGGKVFIHDMRPLTSEEAGAKDIPNGNPNVKERSVVTATVLYDSSSVVDISQIQQRLSQHNNSYAIMPQDTAETDTQYKAENKVLFWLLILLATLVALTILILLLCCICSWCPLYGATTKRIVNISKTEDDVHLVHREMANGKHTKSVQVAEWMGRREAWSAEKPSDTRTKPTRWEFRDGREQSDENLEMQHAGIDNDNTRTQSAEYQQRRVRIKNNRTAKEEPHHSFHNSRTNLINDRDVYIEDVLDDQHLAEIKENFTRGKGQRNLEHTRMKNYDAETRQIDDDSMRRHEIERGSDIDLNTAHNSLKNKRELFIKDGNVEILQLMTRDKTQNGAGGMDEDNIYVNVPMKTSTDLTHPQLLMVDNTGKEILMRRFIEEQPDGKQIIREHYHIVPGATYIQSMPNEIQQGSTLKGDTFPFGKSGPNSIVYSQTEPEVKVIHTQSVQAAEGGAQLQPAISNQSLTQELENSLKQQNALLRQILMEKELLESRYTQHELVLETQSLPGQSMAIGTQTDCDAGTQTEPAESYVERTSVSSQAQVGTSTRRRARSENDDSMSEDEYRYVRFSPPNSPEGVYWIKRRRPKKRSRLREGTRPGKRIVMVEDVKRKIRTPIKEEEEVYEKKRVPPKKPLRETKTSILRKQLSDESRKNESTSHKEPHIVNHRHKSEVLSREVLMEISDSLDDAGSPRRHRSRSIPVQEYYNNSDGEVDENETEYSIDSDDDEIVIRTNGHTTGYPLERAEAYARKVRDAEREAELHQKHSTSHQTKQSSRRSLSETRHEIEPEIKPRLSRRDSSRRSQESRKQTSSEPPHSRLSISKYESAVEDNGRNGHPAELSGSKRRSSNERYYQSETELATHEEPSSGKVPKYMEWYYGKKKPANSGRTSTESSKSQLSSKKKVNGVEKRVSKPRANAKSEDPSPYEEAGKFKPEPAPRRSPPKGSRMLKEDRALNKQHKPKIETDTNHPLLQHSEHRFERENAPEVPAPPTKLPHYMYPETPTYADKDHSSQRQKPKPSPIKENEIKVTKSRINLNVDDHHGGGGTSHATSHVQKQLNASTLEDDHDSGIAMNSLMNSMGRRNPIAEKKSVFSIAYDDVSRVKKITSGGESPQYS